MLRVGLSDRISCLPVSSVIGQLVFNQVISYVLIIRQSTCNVVGRVDLAIASVNMDGRIGRQAGRQKQWQVDRYMDRQNQ